MKKVEKAMIIDINKKKRNHKTKEYVIIVAGGSGSRMKSDIPKQYLIVNNKPIIVHTIEKFFNYNPSICIICCVHFDYYEMAESMLSKYFPGKKILITQGGETRFQSVKNGIKHIQEKNSIVAIHDAARPLVSIETIENAIESAKKCGSGIPVIEINESLRMIENNNTSKAVNRSDYKIVQTPQCFNTELIKKAFETEFKNSFTDDASVFENAGYNVNLTMGNPENIKITLPNDLIMASYLLK